MVFWTEALMTIPANAATATMAAAVAAGVTCHLQSKVGGLCRPARPDFQELKTSARLAQKP